MDTQRVRDAKDVEQVVRAAIASEQPLEIVGHGSRRLIGQPMATNALLELSALNAVTAYEPNELIITVQAGAPLADVQSLIDSKNQQFAFEPMDTSALLGVAGAGTVGGTIGAGLAGPRRIRAGGARDHLLGAHAVSGFGDSFKTGGRVVKNVTGYDLCKLLAGSWGTLAVMTEVTLKVMPKPESERTLVLRGLDDVTANRAMTAALGSPYDVSGASHLPNSAFRPAAGALAGLGASGQAATLLRLEGIAASVADRANSLGKILAPFGAAEILQDATSVPEEEMPVVQLSLDTRMDPAQHIAMGRALAPLRDEGVLILGSGLSFHNLRLMRGTSAHEPSRQFDAWLQRTLVDSSPEERVQRLVAWEQAPAARIAHPREDHLLPLMAVVGAAWDEPGATTYHQTDFVGGLTASSFRFGAAPADSPSKEDL